MNILLALAILFARPGFYEPWGNDANLKFVAEKQEEQVPKKSIATLIAEQIINFHQKVISPVDGPRSHYKPSSSQYMKLAMERYGFVKGYIMGCDRLLRENNEEWVYRTVEMWGEIYKYDPPTENKYERF